MSNIEYISTEKLTKLLYFEDKNYYYNNKKINKAILNKILLNRNITKRINPKRAIIINRCYGKSIPSNIVLYSNISDNYFDRNQLTELNIGLLIHVLHISKDKNWYFVKTYNYYCWVHKNNICIVNTITFNKFLCSNKFIITTDKLYLNHNKYVDMGCIFPIYEELKYTTKIILPNKENNKYKEEIIEINNNYISKDYMKYTHHNLYIQALKYLNTSYGWGGVNNGIDCSSFIANIYKVFGLLLPRDTSKQQEIIGTNIINTINYNFIEKYKTIIKINTPAILYTKGHVMLLLKIKRKNIYVIHSSSKYMKVIISILDNETINKITSIHFINC